VASYDARLIHYLEPITHWTQVSHNCDTFKLARYDIALGALLAIVWVAHITWIPGNYHPVLLSLFFAIVALVSVLIYAVIFTVFALLASVASKFGYKAAEDGARNPFEVELQAVRVFMVAATVLALLIAPVFGVVLLSVALFIYLCSLTPLHPNEAAKIRAERETRQAKALTA